MSQRLLRPRSRGKVSNSLTTPLTSSLPEQKKSHESSPVVKKRKQQDTFQQSNDFQPHSKDFQLPSSLLSPRYFLIKAEPESRLEKGKEVKFSIDDLEKSEITTWDGVRNYEARNTMRDSMKLGDLAFYYHSNCKLPGIIGWAKVRS